MTEVRPSTPAGESHSPPHRTAIGWLIDNRRLVAIVAAAAAVAAYILYRVFTESGVVPALLLSVALVLTAIADTKPAAMAAVLAENWPLFAVLSGGFVLIFLEQITDSEGSMAFYQTVAQVIPLLLLTMALEVRLLPHRPTGLSLRTAMLVVYLLAGAEFAALQSIARGHGGRGQFDFTVAGLVSGFVAVSLIAVSAAAHKRDDDAKESD